MGNYDLSPGNVNTICKLKNMVCTKDSNFSPFAGFVKWFFEKGIYDPDNTSYFGMHEHEKFGNLFQDQRIGGSLSRCVFR